VAVGVGVLVNAVVAVGVGVRVDVAVGVGVFVNTGMGVAGAIVGVPVFVFVGVAVGAAPGVFTGSVGSGVGVRRFVVSRVSVGFAGSVAVASFVASAVADASLVGDSRGGCVGVDAAAVGEPSAPGGVGSLVRRADGVPSSDSAVGVADTVGPGVRGVPSPSSSESFASGVLSLAGCSSPGAGMTSTRRAVVDEASGDSSSRAVSIRSVVSGAVVRPSAA
jgi:hypothetical protein